MVTSSSDSVPRLSLRERKKAATMHRVQQVAIDLFERRGFDAVTIEHIADAADVSPSTIYRYFGTKEGLVLSDEYDDELMNVAAGLIAQHDPWTAAEHAMLLLKPSHFGSDMDMSRRRIALWIDVPAVRAATFAKANDLVHAYAALLQVARPDDYSAEEALVIASSIVWAAIAAIEYWSASGGEGDLVDRMIAAIRLIRPTTG